ncbi:MAG: DUF533 domain-containing protein [Betaproteobacteria bacterium]|nr:DUF533 domain-containing protein [Betaproteobacteria bacterium]
MTSEPQKAILTLALFAAFADGSKDDGEREQIRQLAHTLAGESGAANLAGIYQDVLLKRVSVADAAALLSDPDHRQLAYEMAVCVCNADHRMGDGERRFLSELRVHLGLDPDEASALQAPAESIADAAYGVTVIPAAAAATPPASPTAVAATAKVSDAELDKMILNSAILNGALELLPQSWASIAIIPLQIKLVYRIGKAHGVELDQGHIREFIATAGVGLTSQYLEQFGRKLLGGLLGKAAGGLAKGIGKTATSMAFSFATTYALGQIAKRYYAGGRQMSTATLRESYQTMLAPAKALQQQYLPQIQQTASGLDAAKVMAMVRGA